MLKTAISTRLVLSPVWQWQGFQRGELGFAEMVLTFDHITTHDFLTFVNEEDVLMMFVAFHCTLGITTWGVSSSSPAVLDT